jgi:co-chaperonin GroES (HSP10)
MKIIPFGEKILVRRRLVGEKAGSLYLPDEVKERATDLADVVYIPDFTFSDKKILDNSEKIVEALTEKSTQGDSDALIALLRINEFVKLKSIKSGDRVFISKYVGVDFFESGKREQLTLVNLVDIIGLVVDNG